MLKFLLLFTISSVSSAQVQLYGRQAALTCAAHLVDIFPKVIKGEPLVGYVGNFHELPKLMEDSGVSAEKIVVTVLLFNQLLHLAPKGHILHSINQKVTEARYDDQSLLICVTGAGCRPRYGSALHVAIEHNFDILPFDTAGESKLWHRFTRHIRKDAKPGWYYGATSDRPTSRTILVRGGNDIKTMSWVTSLIHEATHAADFQIVWDWMLANMKLDAAGKEPDYLFQTFVRTDGERPAIHEGFFRILIETRAYMAEYVGSSSLTPRAIWQITNYHLRNQTLQDFKDFEQVTGPIVRAFEIDESNVFEIGESLSQQIFETIEAAAKLR